MKRYGKDFTLNQDLMNDIAIYMDDNIREKVHFELSPCKPVTFLKRYLKLDPNFNELLNSEFHIVV